MGEMGIINVAIWYHIFLHIPVILLLWENLVILRSYPEKLGLQWDMRAVWFGLLFDQSPSLLWYPGHLSHMSGGGAWTAWWWRFHSLSLTAVGSPGYHLPQGLHHLPHENPGKGRVVEAIGRREKEAIERRKKLPTLQEVMFLITVGGTWII